MSFDLRLERVFKAPRAIVFQAWSHPEGVRRWFTPQPLGTGECSLDFTVGGSWVHTMLMPGGQAHTMRARYTEITPPSRLVFEAKLSELEESKIVTTVDFLDEGSGTRLKVRQVFDGDIPLEDARQGWTATLNQLEAELEAV